MNQDPLSQLESIIEPAPISWFPPAIGWWVACVACLLIAAALGWLLYKRNYRAAHRTEAKRLLKRLKNKTTIRQFATEANAILKRTALASYGHALVGDLHGDMWLKFLDRSADMRTFNAPLGQRMLEYTYGKPDIADTLSITELHAACVDWINRHHSIDRHLL